MEAAFFAGGISNADSVSPSTIDSCPEEESLRLAPPIDAGIVARRARLRRIVFGIVGAAALLPLIALARVTFAPRPTRNRIGDNTNEIAPSAKSASASARYGPDRGASDGPDRGAASGNAFLGATIPPQGFVGGAAPTSAEASATDAPVIPQPDTPAIEDSAQAVPAPPSATQGAPAESTHAQPPPQAALPAGIEGPSEQSALSDGAVESAPPTAPQAPSPSVVAPPDDRLAPALPDAVPNTASPSRLANRTEFTTAGIDHKDESRSPSAEDAINAKRQVRTLVNRAHMREAIVAAERAIELDPTDAEVYLLLGAALQETGQWARARETFSRCAKDAKHGPKGDCRALSGR